MLVIGIDPGVNTGLAINDNGQYTLHTCGIVEAMAHIKMQIYKEPQSEIFVRFEDARKRNWFGNAGREQLQGAGSIKRDSAIWQEFCELYHLQYEAVSPQSKGKKLSDSQFKLYTKITGRTSQHSRDAAMLIFNYKQKTTKP